MNSGTLLAGNDGLTAMTFGKTRNNVKPGHRSGFVLRRTQGSAIFVQRIRPVLALFTQPGPKAPTRHAPVHGSYRTNTGKVILALSISAGDRSGTHRMPNGAMQKIHSLLMFAA